MLKCQEVKQNRSQKKYNKAKTLNVSFTVRMEQNQKELFLVDNYRSVPVDVILFRSLNSFFFFIL